jgi:hypothetical protein
LKRRRFEKVRSKSIRARPDNSKVGTKCLRRVALRALHQHIDIDPGRTIAGVRASDFAALQKRRASVAKFLIPPINQFSRNRARRFCVHQELKPGAPAVFIRSGGAIAQNDDPIVPVDGCFDPRITRGILIDRRSPANVADHARDDVRADRVIGRLLRLCANIRCRDQQQEYAARP